MKCRHRSRKEKTGEFHNGRRYALFEKIICPFRSEENRHNGKDRKFGRTRLSGNGKNLSASFGIAIIFLTVVFISALNIRDAETLYRNREFVELIQSYENGDLSEDEEIYAANAYYLEGNLEQAYEIYEKLFQGAEPEAFTESTKVSGYNYYVEIALVRGDTDTLEDFLSRDFSSSPFREIWKKTEDKIRKSGQLSDGTTEIPGKGQESKKSY